MDQLRHPIYKCAVCGNVVELLTSGAGELVCCSQPMKLLIPNTDENGATEKHLPIISENPDGTSLVKVGSLPHPMTGEHYIEWIEIINGSYVNRKYLSPGDAPEASFYLKKKSGIYLRAYCNKHGLWESKE
ncbi:MAG: desulfoferrodoxin [Lentisphaeria bacterium]|nr:desulfoferrodoxin [Lentisphaeria bacterium]